MLESIADKKKNLEKSEANGNPWINPVGGFGDMLMLSGVLKLVNEQFPEQKYNLIRRSNYLTFLKDHPAIQAVGWPSKGVRTVRTDYWSLEQLGPANQRPFQILARHYGLQTPIEEKLYIPGDIPSDSLLLNSIPWKSVNILIAPSSDSPRKMMHPIIWHQLAELMKREGMLVIQVGRLRDLHIRPAYSLLGLTSPWQLLNVVRNCSAIVTLDNFIMHAAHLTRSRAVVVWGATNHEVYGYPDQTHLQMPKTCNLSSYDDCIGPTRNEGGQLYGTACPHGEKHCMNQLQPSQLYEAVRQILAK